MKRIGLLTFVFALISFAGNSFAQSETPADTVNGPMISVDKDVHDYGTIEQGDNGECTFIVTNTGKSPLIISLCKGSCGCTVPTCPKQPIAPGETAEIKVKYNTQRVGPINKSVTITSNAANQPRKVVRISGTVKAKPQGGAPVNGGSGTPVNNQ